MRDERVQELLGVKDAAMFDAYLPDAYRMFADRVTQEAFSAMHRAVGVFYMQSALTSLERLSSLSPQLMLPYRRVIWHPITGGDTRLSPAPIDILGVKKTISDEDDWIDVSYAGGVVTGIPDDGATYWIPEMRFINPHMIEAFSALGIKWSDIPAFDPELYPVLLEMLEEARQRPTFSMMLSAASALAGNAFHSEGENRFSPLGTTCSIATDGPLDAEWGVPTIIEATDPGAGLIRFWDEINVSPMQRMRVRVPGDSYVSSCIVRFKRGHNVYVDGNVPETSGRRAYAQVAIRDASPVGKINITVKHTSGDKAMIEQFLRSITSGVAALHITYT